MQPFIDTRAILDLTVGANRAQALRFREELLHLLRVLEDMHNIPHAVPPKSANNQERAARDGHHNR